MNQQYESKSETRFLDAGLYQGYIGGVVDSYDDSLFCIPDGAARRQYLDAVTRYIKTRSPNLNRSAAAVISDALEEAFPCK